MDRIARELAIGKSVAQRICQAMPAAGVCLSPHFQKADHNEMRQLRRDLDICNSSEHVEDALRHAVVSTCEEAFSCHRQFRWVALMSVSFLAVLQ